MWSAKIAQMVSSLMSELTCQHNHRYGKNRPDNFGRSILHLR